MKFSLFIFMVFMKPKHPDRMNELVIQLLTELLDFPSIWNALLSRKGKKSLKCFIFTFKK